MYIIDYNLQLYIIYMNVYTYLKLSIYIVCNDDDYD